MQDETEHCQDNPLQKVDQLYEELVSHYDQAQDAEIRAASKLLIVALEKIQRFGGPDWEHLVTEYLTLIKENPQKFERIVKCQRYPGRPQR